MAERKWTDWITSPWQSIKGAASDAVDGIGKWITKKVGDTVEGAARERLGPVADMLLPAPAAGGGSGTPAPTTERAAGAPAPAPAAGAASTGAPSPAASGGEDKPWYSGMVDGFKKMFNIGVDTSTGEKKEGFLDKMLSGGGKLLKDFGPHALAIGAGIAVFANGGGFLAALLTFAIAMLVATPVMKSVGNYISGLSGGKSQEVAGKDGPAHVVSLDRAPAQEAGLVATVTTGAKKAWDTTVEVATNGWQAVANGARSLAGAAEKPFSRVLAWTDKLNLPALEAGSGLKTGLLSAVMHAESAGKNNSTSDKEAGGLFQFIVDTGKRYGMPTPQDRFVPEKAATGATGYLKDLSKMFNGHTPSMLAGYNWGEGNVQKLQKQGYTITDDGFAAKDGKKFDILPKETKGYIQKIMGVLPAYAEASTAIAVAKASAAPTVVADAGGRATASGGATPEETAKKAAEELIRRAQSGQVSTTGNGVSVASSGAPLNSPPAPVVAEKPRMVVTTS